jgi:hypothetical protein
MDRLQRDNYMKSNAFAANLLQTIPASPVELPLPLNEEQLRDPDRNIMRILWSAWDIKKGSMDQLLAAGQAEMRATE